MLRAAKNEFEPRTVDRQVKRSAFLVVSLCSVHVCFWFFYPRPNFTLLTSDGDSGQFSVVPMKLYVYFASDCDSSLNFLQNFPKSCVRSILTTL